jgi:hypothetical protein
VWIEMLRTDTAEHFLGLRLNVFTSIVVGLVAVGCLVALRGRPREVITRGAARSDGGDAGSGHPAAADAGADAEAPPGA